MWNLLLFVMVVAASIHKGLPTSVLVLAAVGIVLAAAAGFAAFSNGSFFTRGRGVFVCPFCAFGAACLAVAIGFLGHWYDGLVAAVLFWPITFNIGAQILRWIPEPMTA